MTMIKKRFQVLLLMICAMFLSSCNTLLTQFQHHPKCTEDLAYFCKGHAGQVYYFMTTQYEWVSCRCPRK